MHLTKLALCLALVGSVVTSAQPAAAQQSQRERYVVVRDAEGRIVRDANGRPVRARTRVVVQPRSFLDGGTNVVPGERKFTDYLYRPYYGPGSSPGSTVTNLGNGTPGWDTWPSPSQFGPNY